MTKHNVLSKAAKIIYSPEGQAMHFIKIRFSNHEIYHPKGFLTLTSD